MEENHEENILFDKHNYVTYVCYDIAISFTVT